MKISGAQMKALAELAHATDRAPMEMAGIVIQNALERYKRVASLADAMKQRGVADNDIAEFLAQHLNLQSERS